MPEQHASTSPTRRVGILDLGSNSIKMLVGESGPDGSPNLLLEKSAGTRLGEGIHHHFRLAEEPIKRTLDAIHEFVQRCDEFHISSWHAVATSAVRDSENHHDFQKRFQQRLGFPLRILSGDDEAELIFRGTISDTAMVENHAEVVVMDSGGGSAEWIRGSRQGIQHRICLDLGCVRMTDRFLRGNPYIKDSFNEMIAYYTERLTPLKKHFLVKDGLMIGTGGSICTAAALDMSLPSFRNRMVHSHKLTLDRLIKILGKLRGMTHEERLAIHGLPSKRADIIVAGVSLFVTAMQMLETKSIISSLRGLRYGVLLEALGK